MTFAPNIGLGRALSLSVIAFVFGCSSDLGLPPPSGAGGVSGSGGTTVASGGAAASGGAVSSSGGAASTGGQASSATGGVGSGGTAAGSGGSSGAGSGGAVGGSGGNDGSGGGPLASVTVFIAGDSTVSTYADTASPSDQAGWGQMLPGIFSDQATIDNRAAGGRTALWFYLEGAAQGILDDAEPGDYFFVQFGTNDSNKTATFEVDGTTYQRYAEAGTTFKQHLLDHYITPARAASLIVVLVTPPPRNSAYCGTGNSLGGYAAAMRELGEAENVPVLDLNTKTFDYLASICPAPTPEDFFAFRSDGTVDGTHFQENGARHMATFLGECMAEIDLGLASYLLP